MGKLISILLLVVLFQLPGDFPLEKGRPTGQGVEMYVEQKVSLVLAEFKSFYTTTPHPMRKYLIRIAFTAD